MSDSKYHIGVDAAVGGGTIIRFAFRGVRIDVRIPEGVIIEAREADAVREAICGEAAEEQQRG